MAVNRRQFHHPPKVESEFFRPRTGLGVESVVFEISEARIVVHAFSREYTRLTVGLSCEELENADQVWYR